MGTLAPGTRTRALCLMQQVPGSKFVFCFFFFLCTTTRMGTLAPGTRTRAESTGSTISSVCSFGGTWHSGWSLALGRREGMSTD
jgi:hypothetical protein